MWKFGHHPEWNLEPLTRGPAITRGVTGHSGLEAYYKQRMLGIPHDDAVELVTNKLMEASLKELAVNGDPNKAQMYSELLMILSEYFKYYGDEMHDWEILGVEQKVKAKFPIWDNEFIGQVDLIIRYKRGPHKGAVVPVDHKFLYNFWNDTAFKMSPQSPNYIQAMRVMYPNERIPHMLFNQVRFRMDAKDRFLRREETPSKHKMLEVTANHAELTSRIQKYKALDREQVSRKLTRALVKTTCEYCSFADLCNMEIEGTDTRLAEKVNFRSNSYGYNEKSE